MSSSISSISTIETFSKSSSVAKLDNIDEYLIKNLICDKSLYSSQLDILNLFLSIKSISVLILISLFIFSPKKVKTLLSIYRYFI